MKIWASRLALGAAVIVIGLWSFPARAENSCLVIGSDDYNGDGISDPAAYDPVSGIWEVAGVYPEVEFGGSGLIPVPGDYNGDGVTTIALYEPGGWWYFLLDGGDEDYLEFGEEGEIPVPADYDGDGVTDCALWNPADGTWRIALSGPVSTPDSGQQRIPAPEPTPEPTPENRESPRREAVLDEQQVLILTLGLPGDIPVPGDYSGDGKASPAVWRPSTGMWIIAGEKTVKWGAASDIPVPLDFDGDGALDPTVWRPRVGSSGLWLTLGQEPVSWGLEAAGDIPLSGDFDGDGAHDLAVWRPARTRTMILTALGAKIYVSVGIPGDVPINRRCYSDSQF